MPSEILPTGSTIGILGGGQLGRMLALAAARLGMKTHIYCPDPQSPAFDVTPRHTIAPYEDKAALSGFADAVDVITYEFENVPAETARFLSEHRPLRPGVRALSVAQDRLEEKAFLSANGLPVTPYRAVHSPEDLAEGIAALGLPAVLKTTRLGYDGKGQMTIREGDDLPRVYESLAPLPLVLETFVPFQTEISVVVARGLDGSMANYDPAENHHRNHILATSTVPANVSEATASTAVAAARRIVTALDYCGVLGVEFFVLPDGALLVNEIAPRVHNSGHWTQAVCATDQFEQHIRAVCGWPLGDPTRYANAVMENLIGDDVLALPGRLGPDTRVEIYGKADARPGRKMAHITSIRAKNRSE